MDNIVKYYGLPHSGSRYLCWLLHFNLPNMVILRAHTGWDHGKIVDKFNWDHSLWNSDPHYTGVREKHGELLKREPLNSGYPVTHYKEQIKQLYKNEELPLLILIRNPYDWLLSFNIKHNKKQNWKTLEYSCKLWSHINRDYFTHWWPKKHFIKYENLRDNTEKELDKISDFLSIDKKENYIDSQPHKEENFGKEQCVSRHIKYFGISKEEFHQIFEENIDKEVLNTYIGL